MPKKPAGTGLACRQSGPILPSALVRLVGGKISKWLCTVKKTYNDTKKDSPGGHPNFDKELNGVIMTRKFVHALNEEYRSISGWYQLYKEEIVEQGGKRILFLLGEGEADSACCGSGGCWYALVPGAVVEWKSSKDEDGRPISLVEPVTDPVTREEVRRHIRETEGISQIQFW